MLMCIDFRPAPNEMVTWSHVQFPWKASPTSQCMDTRATDVRACGQLHHACRALSCPVLCQAMAFTRS